MEYQNECIDRLAEISPEIREYVETETYRIVASIGMDEVTASDYAKEEIDSIELFFAVMDLTVQEFLRLGIEFRCGLGDITENPRLIEGFIRLREFVSRDSIIDKLRKQPDFKSGCSDIILAVDVSDAEKLTAILSLASTLEIIDQDTVEYFSLLEDYLKSNAEFRSYIADCISEALSISTIPSQVISENLVLCAPCVTDAATKYNNILTYLEQEYLIMKNMTNWQGLFNSIFEVWQSPEYIELMNFIMSDNSNQLSNKLERYEQLSTKIKGFVDYYIKNNIIPRTVIDRQFLLIVSTLQCLFLADTNANRLCSKAHKLFFVWTAKENKLPIFSPLERATKYLNAIHTKQQDTKKEQIQYFDELCEALITFVNRYVKEFEK